MFDFFYLLPGQSTVVTMNSMSVVSGAEPNSEIKGLHVRGGMRLFIIGYSASLLNSKIDEDDD